MFLRGFVLRCVEIVGTVDAYVNHYRNKKDMNDRELLELAAKAMELQPESAPLTWWFPLEDDGTAFRLACRLRLDIAWKHDSGYVEVFLSTDLKFPMVRELFVGNVDAATRRAIVRAAAAIGAAL